MAAIRPTKKVFYSWQSDSPTSTNRQFIEAVLKESIDQLHAEVEDSPRDESQRLELDKDTKGSAGNVPIFDEIRRKIESCSVYVADVTFVVVHELDVGIKSRRKGMPNSNVMMEYGYALHALDYDKTILLENTALYPDGEIERPFNFTHVRHPISFSLPPDADSAAKTKQKKQLVKVLVPSLKKHLETQNSELKVSFIASGLRPDLHSPPVISPLPDDSTKVNSIVDTANNANQMVQSQNGGVVAFPGKPNFQLHGGNQNLIKRRYASETKKYVEFYESIRGTLHSLLLHDNFSSCVPTTLHVDNTIGTTEKCNLEITITLPSKIVALYHGIPAVLPRSPEYNDSGIDSVISGPYGPLANHVVTRKRELIEIRDGKTIVMRIASVPNLRCFESDLLDSEAFLLCALPDTKPAVYTANCTVIHDRSEFPEIFEIPIQVVERESD